ncbi:MAG: serine protease [Microcoleaceae cyanobacterium]
MKTAINFMQATGMTRWCKLVGEDWVCRTGNVLNPDFNLNNTPDYHPIESQKLVEIIISRLAQRSLAQERISTVFNEPDFLPFRFLEVGIRRGQAVCQLTVQYTSAASQFIVKKLYETASQESGQSLTVADLEEMINNSLDNGVDEERSLADLLDDRRKPLHEFLKSNDNRNKVSELMAQRRFPIATGFLVGYNHLLTAYHALPSVEVIKEIKKPNSPDDLQIVGDYQVEFGYEYDLMGRKTEPIKYKVKNILAFSQELDYALLELNNEPEGKYSNYVGRAGAVFGWIPMTRDDQLIFPSLREHQDFNRHSFLLGKETDPNIENKINNWKLSDDKLKCAIERIYEEQKDKKEKDNIILAFLKRSTASIYKLIENSNNSVSSALKKFLETNICDILEKVNTGNIEELGISQEELNALEKIKDTPLNIITNLEKNYSSDVWKKLAPASNLNLSTSQVVEAIQKGDTETLPINEDELIELILDILKQRAREGEPVNIIQHPKGRCKEVVVSSNWTLLLSDKYVIYEADADFSSSGSPVFNQQWQLVALHNGAIIPSQSQQGVLIHKIVEDLHQKVKTEWSEQPNVRNEEDNQISKSTLKTFIEEFLPKPKTQLNQGEITNKKPEYRKIDKHIHYSNPGFFY